MGSLVGMMVTVFFVGGILYAANKGYSYYEAVEKITFKFTNISNLKMNGLELQFSLTISAINPTSQPINIDAIFLDILLEEKGKKITIAKIRQPEFNTIITAKSATPLKLNLKSNLTEAGPIMISQIIGFFQPTKVNKAIYAIGNITAEGISIPVDEELNQEAA